MADMSELKWWLTGGAANTDPLLSIGGAVSSAAAARILSKSITRVTSLIDGVTVDDAMGGSLGTWTIIYTSSTQTITVTPQGGAVGDSVDISADGEYYVQGSNDGGGIYITVIAASLPGSNTTDTFTVVNHTQKVLDNVPKSESDTGKTYYRYIAIQNDGSVATDDDKKSVTVWVNENTPGQDNVQIAVSNIAASTGAGTTNVDFPNTLTDEFTAPDAGVDSGIVFSNPITEATGLSMGDLTSTAGTAYTKFLIEKRVVPVGVDAKETNNALSLSFSAKV